MKKDGRGFKHIFKHLKDLRKKTMIQATTGKTRNKCFQQPRCIFRLNHRNNYV